MSEIIVHQNRIRDPKELVSLCPFGAIGLDGDTIHIDSGCRMCRLCVKKGPKGVFEYIDDRKSDIDVSRWKGISVFVEHDGGVIHPVTLELLGKARSMADSVSHPVFALLAGHNVRGMAQELVEFGADRVYIYDDPALSHPLPEPCTAVIENFCMTVRPSVMLIGGTTFGRSIAPRAAARLKTGLTADCTALSISDNTDLQQIRPAFGGNIMAHIRTSNTRPQFATVRYKVFNALSRERERKGEIIMNPVFPGGLPSRVSVLEVREKPQIIGIEEADAVVAIGKGFRTKQDVAMAETLAGLLGAQVAGTRPTIEAGWIDPRRQIGLSGRTVAPKLLIACGVSGSVQFIAGMKSSERIIAINRDPEAPIFRVAHYGLQGDLYDILPRLIGVIRTGRSIEDGV